MLFSYKIKLELEVEFEAPLLGVDTTTSSRKIADGIANDALIEMIRIKTSVVEIDRKVDINNITGTIKGSKQLTTIKKQ
jgi:hypothetical protein